MGSEIAAGHGLTMPTRMGKVNANDESLFEVADYFPAEWLEEQPALVAA